MLIQWTALYSYSFLCRMWVQVSESTASSNKQCYQLWPLVTQTCYFCCFIAYRLHRIYAHCQFINNSRKIWRLLICSRCPQSFSCSVNHLFTRWPMHRHHRYFSNSWVVRQTSSFKIEEDKSFNLLSRHLQEQFHQIKLITTRLPSNLKLASLHKSREQFTYHYSETSISHIFHITMTHPRILS